MGDGLFGTGDLPSPKVRYGTSSHAGSPLDSRGPPARPESTSLLDGPGADRTSGIAAKQRSKQWPERSMCQMADFGTVPAGLPVGLTDTEKKLWLAVYVTARERLRSRGQGGVAQEHPGGSAAVPETVRSAVDKAIDAVTEKHSLEYRFCTRWAHSIKTMLAMRQAFFYIPLQ